MAKKKPVHSKTRRDMQLRGKCDRLAVKIVSIVDKHHQFRIAAYGGIEAAREIRELLIKRFS